VSLAYCLAWKRTQLKKAELMRDLHDETGNRKAADRAEAKVLKYIEQIIDLELLLDQRVYDQGG
jgi:hypothetical protein